MIFKFSSKGKWQHGHQKECLKAEMEPCLSTCLGCLVRRARQKHSADRNNKNAGLWQSGAAERATHSRTASRTQPRALEESGLVSRVLRDTEMAGPHSGEPQQNKESGKDRKKKMARRSGGRHLHRLHSHQR